MAFIRLATENDAAQIQTIYSPIVCQSATTFELEVPTVNEMKQRISDTLQTFPWLVCEEQGNVLGYAYAGKHRTRAAYQWSVDVSIYIQPYIRRKGIGRAIYTSLFEMLILQGYYNAYAGITLPNAGSVGLHEALGFRLVGIYQSVGFKLGAWHDVGWWHLGLRRPVDLPKLPLNCPQALGLGGWEEALRAGTVLMRI